MMQSFASESDKNVFGVETSLRNYNRRRKRDCKYFFAKLDYEILRPLLIYNYQREEMHRQDDLLELIRKDENLL